MRVSCVRTYFEKGGGLVVSDIDPRDPAGLTVIPPEPFGADLVDWSLPAIAIVGLMGIFVWAFGPWGWALAYVVGCISLLALIKRFKGSGFVVFLFGFLMLIGGFALIISLFQTT